MQFSRRKLSLNKVKRFLDNYDAPQTKRNFETSIIQFFESVYSKRNAKNLEETVEKYFSESRNVAQDIKKFLKSLNGLAPLTIKLKVSNIKIFLLENDVELPNPTTKELKQILSHVPIQGKALFLTLESSGMRIGEILKSNIDDLYLDEEPARIQIRGENTKTGNSRHAFFSREAKEALVEWLKVRGDYLEAAVAKSHIYKKKPNDSRIFPFDPSTAYSFWRKALHKSKLNEKDKSTGREKIHPHVLRKFFRTRLGTAGIQVDVIEALMGHEGYLTEVYRRYSIEDLRKFYLKGEPALLVFTEAQEVTKLRQEVDERNKALQSLVNGLTVENLDLKARVSRVELENTEMKKQFIQLEKLIPEVKSLKEKLANVLAV